VRAAYVLTVIDGIVMLVQAALGLMFRAKYRDAEWISTTWLGNDSVTLGIVLPLLAVNLKRARAGSDRALLLWLGLLGYAIYNYAFYLFGAALNAFFPLYVTALIGSALALILALAGISASEIGRRFTEYAPVRLIGGYLIVVGISLASVWFAMWAAYAFAGRPTPIAPEVFKLVAALDCVLMVPALVGGGVLLWHRHVWGYVISAIAGIQGSLYLLVLTINSIIFVARGLAESPGEIPLWSSLAATTSAATLWLLGHAGRRLEV